MMRDQILGEIRRLAMESGANRQALDSLKNTLEFVKVRGAASIGRDSGSLVTQSELTIRRGLKLIGIAALRTSAPQTVNGSSSRKAM